MKFEWFLALRYFKGSRKGSGFLSFIKYMSIAGVAIGAAGLLIALSIVHGFKSTINNKILDFAPHITVRTLMNTSFDGADSLTISLRDAEGIESAQMIVQGQVMIQTRNSVSGTTLKGVDPAIRDIGVSQFITEGSYDLSTSDELPGIVIGASLAATLQADIGSVITVYTIDGLPSGINSPEIKQFRLTGIYETGIDQFDDVFALVDLQFSQQLFGYATDEADGIELKLLDNTQISSFNNNTLGSMISLPLFGETIYAVFGNIFAWVELQENMIPLVISGMIIVAAFNLIGTILMMVLERTRDIGILKTLGSKSKTVRKIFMMEGLLVSLVGLAIGIFISLLFYYLQTTYQIIPLSQENYYMSYAPVEPHLSDFLYVSVVTIFLCTLASWLPARIAANTDPVKVITFGR